MPDEPLTYGRYAQKRAALLSRIQAARRVFLRATDPKYTQLSPGFEVEAGIIVSNLETELFNLNNQWRLESEKIRRYNYSRD